MDMFTALLVFVLAFLQFKRVAGYTSVCQEVAFNLYSFAFTLTPNEPCEHACVDKFRILEGIIKPGFNGRNENPATGRPTNFDWLDPCMFYGRICLWYKLAESVTDVILSDPFCRVQHARLCISTSRASARTCRCQRIFKIYRAYMGTLIHRANGALFDCDADQMCQRLQGKLQPTWSCHGSVVIRDSISCKVKAGTRWCRCNHQYRLTDPPAECEEVFLPFSPVSVMYRLDQLPEHEFVMLQEEYAQFLKQLQVGRDPGASVVVDLDSLAPLQSLSNPVEQDASSQSAFIDGRSVVFREDPSAVPIALGTASQSLRHGSDAFIPSSLRQQRAEFTAELQLWLAGEDVLDSLSADQELAAFAAELESMLDEETTVSPPRTTSSDVAFPSHQSKRSFAQHQDIDTSGLGSLQAAQAIQDEGLSSFDQHDRVSNDQYRSMSPFNSPAFGVVFGQQSLGYLYGSSNLIGPEKASFDVDPSEFFQSGTAIVSHRTAASRLAEASAVAHLADVPPLQERLGALAGNRQGQSPQPPPFL